MFGKQGALLGSVDDVGFRVDCEVFECRFVLNAVVLFQASDLSVETSGIWLS